jgi:hypothetical protein
MWPLFCAADEIRFTAMQPSLFADPLSLSNAWADFDNDGDPDLAVSFESGEIRLYRNDAGTFTNVAATAGLINSGGDPRSLAWGDYDADGDVDLYVGYSGYDGPANRLYRNELGSANPGFTEVGAAAGVGVRGVVRQTAFVDYDADGDVDLYVALRDEGNVLLQNQAAKFTDVTDAHGLFEPRRTVGACWFDMDSDGDLDLFTANQNGDRDGLFRNDAGEFVDVAAERDMDQPRRPVDEGSVGCAVTDFDNDGDLDLYVAAYGPDRLYQNDGHGGFTDVATEWGVAVTDHMVAAVWADVQNDGRPDLYVTGFVWGEPGKADYLFINRGDRFENLLPELIDKNDSDHSAQWADYDRDGDLDLALTNSDPSGHHPLFRNELDTTSASRSIQVRVLDSAGRYLLPGAEVRVYSAGTDQLLGLRMLDTGGGYNAQNALPVHVGLPALAPVDIEVRSMSANGSIRTWSRNIDPAEYAGSYLELRIRQ